MHSTASVSYTHLIALHFGLRKAFDAGRIDHTDRMLTGVQKGRQRLPIGIGGLHTGMDGGGYVGGQPGGQGRKAVRRVGKGAMVERAIGQAERGVKGGFGEVQSKGCGHGCYPFSARGGMTVCWAKPCRRILMGH